jgi:hypothetical protein
VDLYMICGERVECLYQRSFFGKGRRKSLEDDEETEIK